MIDVARLPSIARAAYVDAAERALATSGLKGGYARAVAVGYQALSGADLKGNAKHWGRWYAAQRGRVIRALDSHGVATEVRGAHGRRYLTLGPRLSALI